MRSRVAMTTTTTTTSSLPEHTADLEDGGETAIAASPTKSNRFAVPGNRRRKNPSRRKSSHDENALQQQSSSSSSSSCASIFPLVLAVFLWYSLGVVSISSSKVLLTPRVVADDDDEYGMYYHVGGLPPLFLTLQQLLLGSTVLRFAIRMRFLGLTKGIVPLETLLEQPAFAKLTWTGIFFALGFLTTNLAFGAAAPTYVETLKAAEPISSAIFAVAWGIETLGALEVLGLGGIVGGVLLSTTGSNHTASMSSPTSIATATAIVLASNLCFSLRGLYQKLFRQGFVQNKTTTTTTTLDDLNLQFRMQQTGVLLLLVPTLVWNGPGLAKHALGAASHLTTAEFRRVLRNYLLWSIGNGLAFSSYNLASTYLLTRISVVHHAALNCTRRMVAIVCTGILFRIPVTGRSLLGISISFASFLVFTKAKADKQQQQQQNQKQTKDVHKKRDDNNMGNGNAHREIPNGNGGKPSQSGFSNSHNGNHTSSTTTTNTADDSLTHRKQHYASKPSISNSRPAFVPPPPPPSAAFARPRFPPPPPPPPLGR